MTAHTTADLLSLYYPSPTHSVCKDMIVDVLVIPNTCIRGRDIVIALLVRVCVCVSVCLSVCVSPLNS